MYTHTYIHWRRKTVKTPCREADISTTTVQVSGRRGEQPSEVSIGQVVQGGKEVCEAHGNMLEDHTVENQACLSRDVMMGATGKGGAPVHASRIASYLLHSH